MHRAMIVDGLAIPLDLNIFKKRIKISDLTEKYCRWRYFATTDYDLGFKFTRIFLFCGVQGWSGKTPAFRPGMKAEPF
ncbi:MAG: hypothetical protein PWP08_1549 [Methanofollis sp.]|nr:hypothetical protein [Methanofollis sp.]